VRLAVSARIRYLREVHAVWRGAVRLMKCTLCEDSAWVCERHPERPWDGESACGCGAPGAPCPICNAADDEAPRMPSRFRIQFDKEGWQH
jgi:hypothetical protein